MRSAKRPLPREHGTGLAAETPIRAFSPGNSEMFGDHRILTRKCALISREEFTSQHVHAFFGCRRMQKTKVERIKSLHETFLQMSETGVAHFCKDEGKDASVFGFCRVNVLEAAAWSRELTICGAALASNKEATDPKKRIYDLFSMCGLKAISWTRRLSEVGRVPSRWRFAWVGTVNRTLTFFQGHYVEMQQQPRDKIKTKLDDRVWMFDRTKFEHNRHRAEVGAGYTRTSVALCRRSSLLTDLPLSGPGEKRKAPEAECIPWQPVQYLDTSCDTERLKILCTVALSPGGAGAATVPVASPKGPRGIKQRDVAVPPRGPLVVFDLLFSLVWRLCPCFCHRELGLGWRVLSLTRVCSAGRVGGTAGAEWRAGPVGRAGKVRCRG